MESERLEAARVELEQAEQERAEVARLEMERLDNERLELERLEDARLQREQAAAEAAAAEADRAEKQRLADEKRETKRLEKEKAAADAAAAAAQAAASAERAEEVLEDESAGRVAEVLGTSAEGDLQENAKELVVDLGNFEKVDRAETPPAPDPEPELVGVAQKAGIMGAVKAAFTRNGKNHVHDFTEAPGGIGMVRFICRECGYVSISTAD